MMSKKIDGENMEGALAMVVVDATREVNLCLSALHWALQSLPLKPPNDTLLLVGVFHQVLTPMGYKIKVDTNSITGVNHKVIAEAVARKTQEYQDNVDIIEISNQLEANQIKFQIDIQSGSSKIVSQSVAKKLNPTWVVLDRCLKNDKKHFMESLSCNILMMKKDSSVEELKQIRSSVAKSNNNIVVTYDEMIPEIDLGLISPIQPRSDEKKKMKKRGDGRSTYNENDEAKEKCCLIATSLGDGQSAPFSNHETGIADQKPSHSSEDLGCHPFQNPVCSICKNQRPKTTAWKRDFTYSELHAATQGFSPKNFLSEGGFGSVFKGDLNGTKIAVKQHKSVSFQGEKEFKSELEVLSKVGHDNLVMLLGSCSEGTHRLLVYEYVCNGSLDQHLSKHSREVLNWERRMKIALGAANGLQYLHANSIIHRDMRPNNILLTHDYEPMLGDFGLAREGSDHSTDTVVVGTLGYVAPEYAEYGRVSSKTDVYSFGVVLLQLISGRKATNQKLGGKSLIGWARPRLKDRNYPELIDPRIQDSHDVHQLFWMVRVAQRCLCKNPEKRLTMDEVVDALNHIMDNNNMVGGISNLSPTHSDPESSLGSPVDDSISFTTVETAVDPSQIHVTKKPPPSPSIQPVFSMATTSYYIYSPPP